MLSLAFITIWFLLPLGLCNFVNVGVIYEGDVVGFVLGNCLDAIDFVTHTSLPARPSVTPRMLVIADRRVQHACYSYPILKVPEDFGNAFAICSYDFRHSHFTRTTFCPSMYLAANRMWAFPHCGAILTWETVHILEVFSGLLFQPTFEMIFLASDAKIDIWRPGRDKINPRISSTFPTPPFIDYVSPTVLVFSGFALHSSAEATLGQTTMHVRGALSEMTGESPPDRNGVSKNSILNTHLGRSKLFKDRCDIHWRWVLLLFATLIFFFISRRRRTLYTYIKTFSLLKLYLRRRIRLL